jgi:hypothetical protein
MKIYTHGLIQNVVWVIRSWVEILPGVLMDEVHEAAAGVFGTECQKEGVWAHGA